MSEEFFTRVQIEAGNVLRLYREGAHISQPQLAEALGVETKWVQAAEWGGCIFASRIPDIARALHLDEFAQRNLLFACYPELDPREIEIQPENSRAGFLLKGYRRRAGLSTHELAEKIIEEEKSTQKISVLNGLINFWENGDVRLDASRISAISKVLNLTAEESRRLLILRLPALDPEWLNKQPEDKQAGLLLNAYREQTGMSESALEIRIGRRRPMVSQYENGKTKIGKIIDILVSTFSDYKDQIEFDEEYFRQTVARSNEAIRKPGPIIRGGATALGGILSTQAVPELIEPESPGLSK